MLRVRITVIAIGLVLFAGALFFPAVLTYTEWLGDRAVATVTDCHPNGRTPQCRGTWAGRDGRRHSGKIGEVNRSDIGTQIPVRIGPFGARAEHTSSKIAYPAMLLLFGLGPLIGATVVLRRGRRRQQAASKQVLAIAIPSGATRLFANNKRVWRPDGREVAVLRPTRAPLAYTPVSPPGRIPHQRSGSVLEAARWLAHNPSRGARFVAADNPDGGTLFLIHRIPADSYMPETAVLDPGGETRAIIRRVRERPGAFALLAPDGRHLGSITQTDQMQAGYSVRDEHDREVATLAPHRRAWILQLEDGTALRDLALTFAADSYRLGL